MKQCLAIFGVLGILAGLQWLTGAYLNPYYLQILVLIGIQIIMATSLNLIHGYTGLFSLGHAAFMGIGAYAAAAFSVYAHPLIIPYLHFLPTWPQHAFLFLISLAIGSLAAALAGLLLGLPTLRLRGDYLAIATLGFGEIVLVLINNTEAVGGARGFSDIPEFSNFFWVYLFAAATVWIVGKMMASAKGKAFVAIRENEIAALSLGISSTRVKLQAFVLGSALAGLGGGLFAHFFTYLNVNSFGFLKSVEFVVMVVLGGMGKLWSVIAAAIVLTILPEALRSFAEVRMIVYSLLIIATMLLRAKGFSWRKLFKFKSSLIKSSQ